MVRLAQIETPSLSHLSNSTRELKVETCFFFVKNKNKIRALYMHKDIGEGLNLARKNIFLLLTPVQPHLWTNIIQECIIQAPFCSRESFQECCQEGCLDFLAVGQRWGWDSPPRGGRMEVKFPRAVFPATVPSIDSETTARRPTRLRVHLTDQVPT